MQLSKKQKFVLGTLTFLPFLLVVYIILAQPRPGSIAPTFIVISLDGIPLILAFLLSLGLLTFYIIHAIRNKGFGSTERVVWILLFIFISNVAFVIYFFARIRSTAELANTALDSSIG